MRTRMTTMLAAALAVGLTLGLGACDGQLPEPQAASVEVDQMPDLTPEQEQRHLENGSWREEEEQ